MFQQPLIQVHVNFYTCIVTCTFINKCFKKYIKLDIAIHTFLAARKQPHIKTFTQPQMDENNNQTVRHCLLPHSREKPIRISQKQDSNTSLRSLIKSFKLFPITFDNIQPHIKLRTFQPKITVTQGTSLLGNFAQINDIIFLQAKH